jgi:hypothetical protein
VHRIFNGHWSVVVEYAYNYVTFEPWLVVHCMSVLLALNDSHASIVAYSLRIDSVISRNYKRLAIQSRPRGTTAAVLSLSHSTIRWKSNNIYATQGHL